MNVKELKKALEGVDDNRIVVMSKDGEGNSFSPLSDLDENHNYKADSTWSGEIGFAEMTEELKADGYSEGDLLDGEPALILWPVN